MGATQSNGNQNNKLSLADRRYRVNSPRADSLVQQRLSARKIGGVAIEQNNDLNKSTVSEDYLNNKLEEEEKLENKRRRRQSCSNSSITSQETLNTSPSRLAQFMQQQNLQMSRFEKSITQLTILLTRTQRVLIENSWKRAKKGAADGGVGSKVFHTVLTAQPDIKLLFGLEKVPQGRLKYEGQFRRHASVLSRALEYIVKNVQYTDKLGIHFQALGKKHCQMNGGRAFPTHYWDTFLECIIQSLLECDGTSGGRKHRCRETAMAWRSLISFIVQQMRRGFEDERLLRKRFSASLMGIRGVKNNCKSSERSLKSTGRPLISLNQQHNSLHQSFGSLDGSFPFSLQGFDSSTKQHSSNILPVNGRVRASSTISPLAAESTSKGTSNSSGIESISKQYNFDRLMPTNQHRKSGDISTINSNNIQNPSSSSARSASWCAEVTAEQMQKMKISSKLEKEEEGGMVTHTRASWSVSSIDGVTEVFYTPKNVSGDGNGNETIPGPALTAIKLLLDSATNGENDKNIIQDQASITPQLIYARHSFSDFVDEENSNKEKEHKQAFNASQKFLSVAQASQGDNNSSPSQIRRLSAI